jgi:hypothetical protein
LPTVVTTFAAVVVVPDGGLTAVSGFATVPLRSVICRPTSPPTVATVCATLLVTVVTGLVTVVTGPGEPLGRVQLLQPLAGALPEAVAAPGEVDPAACVTGVTGVAGVPRATVRPATFRWTPLRPALVPAVTPGA